MSSNQTGTSCEDEQINQRLNKEVSCTYPQKRDSKSTSSSRASSPAQLEAAEKLKQVKTRLQLVDLAGSECVGKQTCLFMTKLLEMVGMDPPRSELKHFSLAFYVCRDTCYPAFTQQILA